MVSFFDHYILIFVTLAIGGIASWITKSTFNKYSKIGSQRGYTGAQAAAEMLKRAGIYDVQIHETSGFLSDHYNPMSKTLGLSRDVYHSQSLSAIGVACHEAGHAIQHAQGSVFLWARSALVPATNFCTSLYIFPILISLFMHIKVFGMIGLSMCAMALVFALVTLPVEWDASRRAKLAMVEQSLLTPEETRHAGTVLNAAFLTYVAAGITALITLLYWARRLGLLRR